MASYLTALNSTTTDTSDAKLDLRGVQSSDPFVAIYFISCVVFHCDLSLADMCIIFYVT